MAVITRWLLLLLLLIAYSLRCSVAVAAEADPQNDNRRIELEVSLKQVRAQHRLALSKKQTLQQQYQRAENRYRAQLLSFKKALPRLTPNGMKDNWPVLSKAKAVVSTSKRFQPILRRYTAADKAEKAVNRRLVTLEAQKRKMDADQVARQVALNKAAKASAAKAAAPRVPSKDEALPNTATQASRLPSSTSTTASVKALPASTRLWPDVAQKTTRLQVAYARKEWQRLSSLPKAPSPIGRVKMRSKRLGTETFRYLGESFYALDLSLSSGSYDVNIFDHDYRIDIPADMEKQRYQWLLDVKSLVKPQLYVFPKSLLRSGSQVGGR